MILSAFSLEGKVAVVTGCDTGLGQGMALGWRKRAVTLLAPAWWARLKPWSGHSAGASFLSLTADLRKIDNYSSTAGRAVAELVILISRWITRLIRREDALEFSEKDWDDVMSQISRAYSSCLRQRRGTLSRKAMAARLSISREILSFGADPCASYTASKSVMV